MKTQKRSGRARAVVTARQSWTSTQYRGISRRDNCFRVVLRGGHYHGSFASLREAKDYLVSLGYELIKERVTRERLADLVEKSQPYLDWVVATKYEPGDFSICKTIRGGGDGFLARAAPCTYTLGVEGKEGPW